jgi:thioredoxin-related protein
MKRWLCVSAFVFAMLGLEAQTNEVIFDRQLNWSQILQKAKADNKFIFVDCMATWCVPCRKMDKEVYTDTRVGAFLSDHFISVKLQIDTSKYDDAYVKSWYAAAREIGHKFRIISVPTFLIFSPMGIIVHKDMGFKSPEDLLGVLNSGLDTNQQYYSLLKRFKEKRLPYPSMPSLAKFSRSIGDLADANRIANDYIDNFLLKLTAAKLFTVANIEFMAVFLTNSSDKSFQFFFQNVKRIDKVMNRNGYTNSYLDNIIAREQIKNPGGHRSNEDPNWAKLEQTIRKKYGRDYADRIVLKAQVNWYYQQQDWSKAIDCYTKKIDRYGMDTAALGWVFMNNMIFEVFFKHCANEDTLLKALNWIIKIDKTHPNDPDIIDTYANLLYKLGRVEEAIAKEEIAMNLEKKIALKAKKTPNPSFQDSMEKMKSKVPTW